MTNNKQAKASKWEWLKERTIPLTTLVLVIAITAGLFLFYYDHPERIEDFENYGYLGAFLISLVANATVILPMPGLLVLIALGAVLNPILVGLIGAAGGTIGELTGYTAGYSGRGLARSEKMYTRAEGWMRKRGFLTVFLFALLPILPLDIAGLVAGVLRFPIWKFFLACFLGKALLYILLTYTGAWGWEVLTSFFGC